MAGYAPPPAEEFTDSDDDDFSFAPPASTGYRGQNLSSNNANTGGFNTVKPAASPSTRDGKSDWTIGGRSASSTSKSPREPPKSKIPVVSPTYNGVNIEDFRLSVIKGNTESTQKCIDQGVDVNIRFKTGWTPLMYAAHQINEPLIKLLLDSGASPVSSAPGSTTALMRCCTSNIMNREQDVEKCVNILIQHGAEVSAEDKYMMTPLMYASKKGHVGAIKVLLEHGADINKQEQRGFSPLCWACGAGNLSSIKALVKGGADVNVRTVANQTPLNLASSSANLSLISAYFTSLPGFQPDPYDDVGDWVPPSPRGLLSNGSGASHTSLGMNHSAAASAQQQPFTPTYQHNSANSAPRTSNDTNTSSMDKTSPAYTRFGDLEIFLHGLELSSLIPHFEQHSITLDHLLTISDDELIKVGVHSVGHRKLILDSVHELHKREWKPSSIPAYEKVRTGKQLNCTDVTSIVANVANHSAYITASLKYVTAQVDKDPSLLQVDKNGRGLHALRRFIHELQINSENQSLACGNLKIEIEQTLAGGAAETVDEITHNTTQKSGNRLVIYSSALVSLAVISLSVYVISKKFPHIKIPFMDVFQK